jgi:hypothetical protein
MTAFMLSRYLTIFTHYHIDGRFEMAPRLRHYFKIEDGHTSSVIWSEGSTNYRFLAIQIRQFRCERSYTGLVLPEFQTAGMISYEQWYNGFIGKRCLGRKCPHFGTDMLEKDGLLVCPMHHLTADLKNLQIIERKILH